MSASQIQTTVVGSYPVPAWLAAFPTATALRDAILVVLKTQELAGLDVIADGELSRFARASGFTDSELSSST